MAVLLWHGTNIIAQTWHQTTVSNLHQLRICPAESMVTLASAAELLRQVLCCSSWLPGPAAASRPAAPTQMQHDGSAVQPTPHHLLTYRNDAAAPSTHVLSEQQYHTLDNNAVADATCTSPYSEPHCSESTAEDCIVSALADSAQAGPRLQQQNDLTPVTERSPVAGGQQTYSRQRSGRTAGTGSRQCARAADYAWLQGPDEPPASQPADPQPSRQGIFWSDPEPGSCPSPSVACNAGAGTRNHYSHQVNEVLVR